MDKETYSNTLTASSGETDNAGRAANCLLKALRESQCTLADFNDDLGPDDASLSFTVAGTAEQCAIAKAVIDGWAQDS